MANVEYPMVIKTVSEEDGGGYLAFSPDLKGCMADGESPEEAVTNLKDAIQEWIDEAKRLGREVPKLSSAALAAGRERQIMKRKTLEAHGAQFLDDNGTYGVLFAESNRSAT